MGLQMRWFLIDGVPQLRHDIRTYLALRLRSAVRGLGLLACVWELHLEDLIVDVLLLLLRLAHHG